MTAISPGDTSSTPSSVAIFRAPSCGTINSSPSASKKTESTIERFAAYR
jgi:hypothetical protein